MCNYAQNGVLERDGDACLELLLANHNLHAALNQKEASLIVEQLFNVQNICICSIVFELLVMERKDRREQKRKLHVRFLNCEKG